MKISSLLAEIAVGAVERERVSLVTLALRLPGGIGTRRYFILIFAASSSIVSARKKKKKKPASSRVRPLEGSAI